jgi:hypothetical protein
MIDTETGRLRSSLEWPTRAMQSSVQPTAAGFVAKTGTVLRLYTARLLEIARIPLSANEDDREIMATSTSGRTILVRQYHSVRSTLIVFDAGSGRLKANWEDPLPWRPASLPFSASDSAVAKPDSDQQAIVYSNFGTEHWQTIAARFKAGCVTALVWIDDAQLLNVGCGRMSMLSTHGDLTAEFEAAKHWTFFGKVALSQNGGYAAARQDMGKGGGLWDRDVNVSRSRVIVYDLRMKRTTQAIDFSSPPPSAYYDLALSPDGSRLAILAGETVAVYKLTVSR